MRAPSIACAEGENRIPGEVRAPIATVCAACRQKCFEEQKKAQEDDLSMLNAWRVATEREDPMASGRQRPGENGEGQPMTALSTVRRGIFERHFKLVEVLALDSREGMEAAADSPAPLKGTTERRSTTMSLLR